MNVLNRYPWWYSDRDKWVSPKFKYRTIPSWNNRGRHFYKFQWGGNYHRKLADHLWLFRIPNKGSTWHREYFELNNRKGQYRHISCKRNVK